MDNNVLEAYAPAILRLYQKPLYREERTFWDMLCTYRQAIEAYLARVGLNVVLSEEDGYAFLHQEELVTQASQPLPRLMRQERLSYYETILCVEIRAKLAAFERDNFEQATLLLMRQDIDGFFQPYFPMTTNAVPHAKKMKTALKRLLDLGFLKCIQEEEAETYFEVKPIIKAKLSLDELIELKEYLQNYGNECGNQDDSEQSEQ